MVKMVMKIKVFKFDLGRWCEDSIEREINSFMEDREVINIQTSVVNDGYSKLLCIITYWQKI